MPFANPTPDELAVMNESQEEAARVLAIALAVRDTVVEVIEQTGRVEGGYLTFTDPFDEGQVITVKLGGE